MSDTTLILIAFANAILIVTVIVKFFVLCGNVAAIRRIMSEKFESTPTPDPSANALKLLGVDMGIEGGDRTAVSVGRVDKNGNISLEDSFEVKNYPPKIVDD